MTDYLKPVKAWATTYKGRFRGDVCLNKHDIDTCHQNNLEFSLTETREDYGVLPVTITSAEWLTRAEFEASDMTEYCWAYDENTPHIPPFLAEPEIFEGVVTEYRFDNRFVCGTVTHVLPIPTPEAPSEPTK